MPGNPNNQARCFFNDFALELGAVGLGVYTKRLLALLGKAEIPLHLFSETPELRYKKLSLPWGLSFLSKISPVQLAWHNLLLRRQVKQIGPRDLFVSPQPIACPLPQNSIVVFHDLIPHHYARYDGRFYFRRWNREKAERFSKRASHIVAISEFTKKELLDLLDVDSAKVTVIPNWVGGSFSPNAHPGEMKKLKTKYQLPDPYWLYIGGYDCRKNVEFLLSAYAQAVAEVECPPLVLAGKIPSRQRHRPVCQIDRTLAELPQLRSWIHRPGLIAHEDIPALYRCAKLLIFPSLMEGFGYTPAEAMACGCPVLVADNSALQELVPDRKFRFSTANTAELVQKLRVAARHGMAQAQPGLDLSSSRALAQWRDLLHHLGQNRG